MKTAKEWFNQLPEPIRSQAIWNAVYPDSEYISLEDAIIAAFDWEESPEGANYWVNVHDRAERGDFDQQAKLTCTHFAEFMAEQRRLIQAAIDEHKWYLSEQAKHDVGYKAAEADFLDKHMVGIATSYRADYCGKCADRGACGVAI